MLFGYFLVSSGTRGVPWARDAMRVATLRRANRISSGIQAGDWSWTSGLVSHVVAPGAFNRVIGVWAIAKETASPLPSGGADLSAIVLVTSRLPHEPNHSHDDPHQPASHKQIARCRGSAHFFAFTAGVLHVTSWSPPGRSFGSSNARGQFSSRIALRLIVSIGRRRSLQHPF
jgi:hypothetical protein